MIWAIIFVSITLYHTLEIRPALMMAYLIILPFGAFRLQWRGIFGITLFTLASYAVTLFFFQQSSAGQWSPEVEVIIGITFLLAMMGSSSIVLSTGYSIIGGSISLVLLSRLTKGG